MKTIYQLEDFEPTSIPISLTIGNFDGVHLGHQAILDKLKKRGVVFTFSNHPIEVLKKCPFYYLTTIYHRLKLFKEKDIDTTLLFPFTKAFSKQSPETFLVKLQTFIPFSHLVLGYDAVLGYARKGDLALLYTLSKKLGFILECIEPIKYQGINVSSSEIRKQIEKGCFERASALLGRPYSIVGTVEPGAQQGHLLGFQTANLKVDTLCLPPLGVYIVRAIIKGKQYLGVANLGKAPTLYANRPPILEVHLIDYKGDLYQQPLEVVFLKFLRQERRFESIESLKAQIQKDIDLAVSDPVRTEF